MLKTLLKYKTACTFNFYISQFLNISIITYTYISFLCNRESFSHNNSEHPHNISCNEIHETFENVAIDYGVRKQWFSKKMDQTEKF